jgi:tight adherence protein C
LSPAGALAALAALLGVFAVRELLAGGLPVSRLPLRLEAHSAHAALRLGIPERLRRAGLEGRLSLSAVMVAKALAAGVGVLFAGVVFPSPAGKVALPVVVALPLLGFMAPDLWLARSARQQHRRLLAALPDALDLLAVNAGSGRGVLDGLRQLAAGQGVLAEELRRTVAELACGVPLGTALGRLRERIPGSELARLVAAIERSRTYGSPLGDQLRRQASGLRQEGRRAVEEQAARAAPKIQLVVALVLVPSVLLMIAAGLIANAGSLLAGY